MRRQILSGSIAWRVLLRTFILVSAMSTIPLFLILSGSGPGLLFDSVRYNGCDVPFMFMDSPLLRNRFLNPIWGSIDGKEGVNVTTNVVRELLGMQIIDPGAKSLCVDGPLFSLQRRRTAYELEYADESFDFVLSGDLDKVSVPAAVVLESERVLRPGGVGAVLVGFNSFNTNSLIRKRLVYVEIGGGLSGVEATTLES
ncbi:hypothetical protein OIU84_026111 [Salix udensis]|uniref:Methyltransferase type 11 domain-containing protein n=1 Tax=Salix udensis TaxID=889485 RepID=A0AAD6PDF7_9ROSI|nr:hypothetical protein OIU84_026111 [Salix udensis]